jgi:hypothetical protein
LKILLSAFACEPNRGPELGVGWNWALFLARAGQQVVVLTRFESRPAIERSTTASTFVAYSIVPTRGVNTVIRGNCGRETMAVCRGLKTTQATSWHMKPWGANQ